MTICGKGLILNLICLERVEIKEKKIPVTRSALRIDNSGKNPFKVVVDWSVGRRWELRSYSWEISLSITTTIHPPSERAIPFAFVHLSSPLSRSPCLPPTHLHSLLRTAPSDKGRGDSNPQGAAKISHTADRCYGHRQYVP